MKALPAGLQAHLDTGATTLCWCWKLTRKDAAVMGFTDHDADLVFDGVTFHAATGFTASEVQSTLGLAVDNLTAIGALSAASITEDDLAAGVYDDADIEIWRVNWSDPAQRVLMRKGSLGEVARGKTAFEAEVRGLAHNLNQPVGRAFLRSCDADLGDARCGINLTLSPFKGTGAVVAVLTEARVFTASGLSSFASAWFTGGKVTWTSGPNTGRAMEVKAHGKSAAVVTVELWQAMSEEVAAGHGFTITAGCDKQFATCKAKFNNAARFRGFPWMPGNDAVVAYPNRGEGSLDGGSLFN
jgi:uncharacterized phage protein (TIGR02218 family)